MGFFPYPTQNAFRFRYTFLFTSYASSSKALQVSLIMVLIYTCHHCNSCLQLPLFQVGMQSLVFCFLFLLFCLSVPSACYHACLYFHFPTHYSEHLISKSILASSKVHIEYNSSVKNNISPVNSPATPVICSQSLKQIV